MEQFGLWNLLKSMLSAGQQQPQNSESSKQSAPQATDATPTPSPQTDTPMPTKENACEQFLLRHETLRQKRK